MGLKWPEIQGDFWEYKNSKVDAYWTGYFSTDPQFKQEVFALSDLADTYQLITNIGSFSDGSLSFDFE